MPGHRNGGRPIRLPDPYSLEFRAQRIVLLELVVDPPADGDRLGALMERLGLPPGAVEPAVAALEVIGLARLREDVVRATPPARTSSTSGRCCCERSPARRARAAPRPSPRPALDRGGHPRDDLRRSDVRRARPDRRRSARARRGGPREPRRRVRLRLPRGRVLSGVGEGLSDRHAAFGRPAVRRSSSERLEPTADFLAEGLARDVASRAAAATLDDEAGVEQAPEVVAGGRSRHVSLAGVRRPVDALEEALLERYDEALWPAAVLDELLEAGPAGSGLRDLLEPALRLIDVGPHAEPDPGGGVAPGLVAAAWTSCRVA